MKAYVETEFTCTAETLKETTLRPPAPIRTLLIISVWMLASVIALYTWAAGAQLDSISTIASTASLLASVVAFVSLLGNILGDCRSLPRTVTLSHHNISCAGPLGRTECSLTDCCWYEKRGFITVQMPVCDLGCGYTPKAKQAVRAFLERCDIRQLPSRSLTFSFGRIFLGITIGAGAGHVICGMLWLLGSPPQSRQYWLYLGAILGMYLGWWHASFPYHWRTHILANPGNVFLLRTSRVFMVSVLLALAVRDAPMNLGSFAVAAIVIGAILTSYQRWRYYAFYLDWKAPPQKR